MTAINLRRAEDVYALPPGTQIDRSFFVNDEGTIQTADGDAYSASTFVGYEVQVSDNPFVRRRETFEEFRQRLCVMARGFQKDHGVSSGPVYALLRQFDCWFEGVAEPGQWVYRSDDLMTAPPDRVLTVGVRSDWEHYGVFAPTFAHLFGGLRSTRFARVEGPWSTPTEEDREQIRALKVQVWEAGVQAKANQAWCSAFERMVGSMRIDANVRRITATAPVGATGTNETASGLVVGQATTVDQRLASPLGSIFEWNGTPGARSWNWCVRKEPVTNRAGTAHLCGPNTGMYSSGRQDTVVHDGSQPMWIEVPTTEAGRRILEALPIGTHLSTGSSREASMGGIGHVYKHDNGWHANLTRTTAAMTTESLTNHGWPLHIMEMPGVPGAEPSQGPGAVDPF